MTDKQRKINIDDLAKSREQSFSSATAKIRPFFFDVSYVVTGYFVTCHG